MRVDYYNNDEYFELYDEKPGAKILCHPKMLLTICKALIINSSNDSNDAFELHEYDNKIEWGSYRLLDRIKKENNKKLAWTNYIEPIKSIGYMRKLLDKAVEVDVIDIKTLKKIIDNKNFKGLSYDDVGIKALEQISKDVEIMRERYAKI